MAGLKIPSSKKDVKKVYMLTLRKKKKNSKKGNSRLWHKKRTKVGWENRWKKNGDYIAVIRCCSPKAKSQASRPARLPDANITSYESMNTE